MQAHASGMQKISTNITDEVMSDHIEKVVETRHADEVAEGGITGALEVAIKEINGNAASLYGRFGDMAVTRVLQNILDGVVSTTAEAAPAVKN